MVESNVLSRALLHGKLASFDCEMANQLVAINVIVIH
jgi:hypothetical protein